MKFAFRKLKYIHFGDIIDMLKILLSFIPGMILKAVKKDIWLVSERENDAHDNGYWFYKYVRENYPEKNVYYSISFNCPDYENRIKPLGNAIKHGSFKHHIYFWAASKYISAHIGNGFPAPFMCRLFLMSGFYRFKVVFLQHGVTSNVPDYLLNENNKIDLFTVSAEREEKSVIDDLHYAPDKVVRTGMCRFDNLLHCNVMKNRILIMPTWRHWLYPEYGKKTEEVIEDLRNSNYYKNFKALFSDQRLLDYAEKNHLELVYFPHNQMQPFIDEFKKVCPRIICAKATEYDVQQALKDSAFLITDYSSIFFDFAYMKKPLLYFQFDYDEFREKHYAEGYFDFSKDGFGPVCKTVDQAVDCLIESFEKNFDMDEIYQKRVDEFFIFKDGDNCKRNYEAVEAL